MDVARGHLLVFHTHANTSLNRARVVLVGCEEAIVRFRELDVQTIDWHPCLRDCANLPGSAQVAHYWLQ